MKYMNYYLFLFIVLLFFNNIFALRAKLIYGKPNEHHWQDFKQLAPWLEKYGLFFVENKPDVIFCDDITVESQKKYGLPIIMLERRDSATVSYRVAQWLECDYVKAVFKNYVLQPVELNNAPRCADMYHFKLVNDGAQLFAQTEIHLSDKALRKIRCVPWSIVNTFLGNSVPWAMWTHKPGNYTYSDLKKEPIKFKFPRSIGVLFIGTTDFAFSSTQASTLYTYHREQAVQAIASMKRINRMIVTGKRMLPFGEYIKQMKRAKIVVSPWGYGEWCWRDFEAMLSGAVVIKPRMNFIKTVPNIYQENVTYVACEPDFSDLEEKVRYVLSHYNEFRQMRINARTLLLEHDNLDVVARYFVENVKAALAMS